MKTYIRRSSPIVTALLLIFSVSCNSGDSARSASDTAQHVPGTNDSIPSVVNPGMGDTSSVIKTPGTNDDNTIMPDSTTVAQ